MKLPRNLRRYDWDAVAVAVAAVVALVLHLLKIADQDVILTVILVALAVMLIRDLRREDRDDRLEASVAGSRDALDRLSAGMAVPDAVLVGPRQLRAASETFARRAHGEMIWFNVCLLMFRPQPLFDALLKPAIENPDVTTIQFTLDERERQRWNDEVMPKVAACAGRAKVREPHWAALDESVSFILAEMGPGTKPEAQLSFWGEPFMARSTERDVPRYIFHVQSHSELVPHLVELDRKYRFGR